MDIATWNTNSLRVRLPHLSQWIEQADPDVICLQETKVVDSLFPAKEIAELGYPHQAIYGQKTYNGVAILSKHPLSEVKKGFSTGEPDPQARLLQATVQGIHVLCCYVPNGNRVGSDKFHYKLGWLKRLRTELDQQFDSNADVLVCGDMNIAPEDEDTWDPFEADGQILFHPAEHKALKEVTDWGLIDALRAHIPRRQVFTWWDYRAAAFRRKK